MSGVSDMELTVRVVTAGYYDLPDYVCALQVNLPPAPDTFTSVSAASIEHGRTGNAIHGVPRCQW